MINALETMLAVCSNSRSVDIENCNLNQQKICAELPALFILNLEHTVVHARCTTKSIKNKSNEKK